MNTWGGLRNSKYLATLPVALVCLIHLLVNRNPIGNGGLYLIWTNQLSGYWPLPIETTSYSIFTLPYAFPPLGFWMTNLIHDLSGVSRLTAMRWLAPAVYLVTWPVYWMWVRDETNSRIATTATLIASLTPLMVFRQITISGITTGLGDVFLLMGILLTSRTFVDEWHWPHIAGVGIAFGLTVLSHPAAGLAFGIWVFVHYVFADRTVQGFSKGVIIASVGFLISSIWWIPVFLNHGPDLFLTTMGKTNPGSIAVSNIFTLLHPFETYGVFPLFAISLPVIGGSYMVLDEAYRLPAIATVLLATTHVTFAYYIFALFIAVAIWKIIVPQLQTTALGDRLPYFIVVVSIVLLITLTPTVGKIVVGEPAYSKDDMGASEWLKSETSPDATIVAAGPDTPIEWLPYLSERRLAIGYWGTEWTTRFSEQSRLTAEIRQCTTKSCVGATLQAAGIERTYVYVQRSEFDIESNSDIGSFEIVYQNDNVVIFEFVRN